MATPAMLRLLPLSLGQNDISFICGNTEVKGYIYFMEWNTRWAERSFL